MSNEQIGDLSMADDQLTGDRIATEVRTGATASGSGARTAPQRPRSSGPLRVIGVLAGAVFILGAVIVPVLPLVTGSAASVQHSLTEEVPVENHGVYLDTVDGAMQLFTWEMPLDRFPADAPTLSEGSIQRLVVVQRGFAEPGRYVLYRFDDSAELPWATRSVRGREMTLIPEQLPAGRYVFLSPSDSTFGGTEYQYFAVGDPTEAGR